MLIGHAPPRLIRSGWLDARVVESSDRCGGSGGGLASRAMRTDVLEQADRSLAALPPGRREAIREIVVDAVHRGGLPPAGRAFITRVTGSTFLADVLSDAIAERAGIDEPRTGPDRRVE